MGWSYGLGYTISHEFLGVTCISIYAVGLRTVTLASIDESVFAGTREDLNYSGTHKVLYYHPRNEAFV